MDIAFVRQLIDSLEIMVAISEAQSVSLAESRREAKVIEQLWESRMSGSVSRESFAPSFSVEQSMARLRSVQDSVAQIRRREEALLSVFEALMRLWSNEGLRSKCETIFEDLRQMRLIDVSENSTQFPLEGIQKLEGKGNLPLDQRRESILDAMKAHHEGMKDWMTGREAEWDEKIERSDRLLKEALEIARSMAP